MENANVVGGMVVVVVLVALCNARDDAPIRQERRNLTCHVKHHTHIGKAGRNGSIVVVASKKRSEKVCIERFTFELRGCDCNKCTDKCTVRLCKGVAVVARKDTNKGTIARERERKRDRARSRESAARAETRNLFF